MQRYLKPKTYNDQIWSQLKTVVESKASKIVESTIHKIRDKAAIAVKNWRLEVRFLLSRKYVGGINTTLFPKLRTGALRASVPSYIVSTNKTYYGTALLKNETVISLKRSPLKHPWDTYGDVLDRWPTQLGGWKDRAYSVLNKNIERVVLEAKQGRYK